PALAEPPLRAGGELLTLCGSLEPEGAHLLLEPLVCHRIRLARVGVLGGRHLPGPQGGELLLPRHRTRRSGRGRLALLGGEVSSSRLRGHGLLVGDVGRVLRGELRLRNGRTLTARGGSEKPKRVTLRAASRTERGPSLGGGVLERPHRARVVLRRRLPARVVRPLLQATLSLDAASQPG